MLFLGGNYKTGNRACSCIKTIVPRQVSSFSPDIPFPDVEQKSTVRHDME